MKKWYLIGAVAFPLLGILVWKLFFPQISGLDGIFLFMLGTFCLWSAVSCPLGLLTPESSPGYRWAYGGVFFSAFLVQLLEVFTDFSFYTLADIVLLSALYLIQHQEQKGQGE